MCHFRNVLDRNSVMWNDFVSQCGKVGGKRGSVPASAATNRNRSNRIHRDSPILRLAVTEFLADGEAGFLYIGLHGLNALVIHILRGG